MTDRELLEYAAKAAGYKKYYAHHLGRDSFVTYDDEYYSETKERRVVGEKTLDWNPLADDGDAFRLAHTVPMIVTPGTARLLDGSLFGVDNKDIAATRRAIVEAAAVIGRGMV